MFDAKQSTRWAIKALKHDKMFCMTDTTMAYATSDLLIISHECLTQISPPDGQLKHDKMFCMTDTTMAYATTIGISAAVSEVTTTEGSAVYLYLRVGSWSDEGW